MNETMKVLQWIGSIVGGGGLTAFGLWLRRFLKQRAQQRAADAKLKFELDNQAAVAKGGRLESVIEQYRKLIKEKEEDAAEQRAAFAAERSEMRKEIHDLRAEAQVVRLQLQQYLVDIAGMQSRIMMQERDINALTGGLHNFMSSDRFDPIIFADTEGEICYANEAASLFTGYPLRDLLRMNTDQLVPPALLEAHRAGMERIKAAGPMPRGQVGESVVRGSLLHRDGTIIPTDVSISTFTIGDKIGCRSQLRRRFDRPGEGPVMGTGFVSSRVSATAHSEVPLVEAHPSASISPIVAGPTRLPGPDPPAPADLTAHEAPSMPIPPAPPDPKG